MGEVKIFKTFDLDELDLSYGNVIVKLPEGSVQVFDNGKVVWYNEDGKQVHKVKFAF